MPRSYRHIKDYEKEILELKENGLTHLEIGKKFGFTKQLGQRGNILSLRCSQTSLFGT